MEKSRNERKKFWNGFNIALVLAFTAISAYVYIGFFFPDKSFVGISWIVARLQLVIWLFFPVGVITLIALYRAVYLGALKLGSVIFLLFVFLFFLLAFYPYVEYKYSNGVNQRMENVHAFLHLTPNEIEIKNDSSFTIFCLGGSTTEFQDHSGRDWPTMLGERMKTDSAFSNIEIYNSGKQWYTSQHILTNYIQNLKSLNPDAIIIMENINDLLQNADFSKLSKGEFREDYGHFLGPFSNIIKYNGFTALTTQAFKKLWYQDAPQIIETDYFPGLNSFEKNLKALIELAQADQTLVILMTQPNIYKEDMSKEELQALTMLNYEAVGNGKYWSYNTVYTGINLYNNKIKQIAKEKNVELIDLEKKIPKSLDYFYDDVHYQDKAYDVIVEYLTEELSKILKKQDIPKNRYRVEFPVSDLSQ